MRVVAKVQGGEGAGLMNNAFSATGWDLLAEVVGRKGAMPKLRRYSPLATRTSPPTSSGRRARSGGIDAAMVDERTVVCEKRYLLH